MQDLQEILNVLKMVDAADILAKPSLLEADVVSPEIMQEIFQLAQRSKQDWYQCWKVLARALDLGEVYLAGTYGRLLVRNTPAGASPPIEVNRFTWALQIKSAARAASSGDRSPWGSIDVDKLTRQEREWYDWCYKEREKE